MNLLKSECLKWIYNRWLVFTVVGTIFLVPLLILFLHETPDKVTETYLLTQVVESYYLGLSGVIVLTILFIGQEFAGSTLRSSLLLAPRRWTVLLCKLTVLLLTIILLWGIVTSFSMVAMKIGYGVVLFKEMVLLAIQVAVVSISLVIICFCLVLLTKSIIFSIGISLSFLLGLGQMLLQFSDLFRYFPILSTMNLFFISDSSTYLPFSQGLMIQYLWAIVLLGISGYVFRRRSIR